MWGDAGRCGEMWGDMARRNLAPAAAAAAHEPVRQQGEEHEVPSTIPPEYRTQYEPVRQQGEEHEVPRRERAQHRSAHHRHHLLTARGVKRRCSQPEGTTSSSPPSPGGRGADWSTRPALQGGGYVPARGRSGATRPPSDPTAIPLSFNTSRWLGGGGRCLGGVLEVSRRRLAGG